MNTKRLSAVLTLILLLAADLMASRAQTITSTDLTPTSFRYTQVSQVFGVSGNTQVGSDSINGYNHALLWTGTAASAIDLNPTKLSGFTSSIAQSDSGSTQVGWGYGSGTGGNTHALLWTGTADSAVDLNAFLPSGFNTMSQAYGINSTGDIVAIGTGTGGTHAFLLHVIAAPEPSPSTVLGLGALGLGGLMLRARRRVV